MVAAFPEGASMRPAGRSTLLWLTVLLLSAGCGGSAEELPGSYVRLSIDKSEPERLIRYYLGGYVTPEPSDPFEVGVAARRNGRFYVNVDSLDRHLPRVSSDLVDADASNRIEWEEFEQFINETYRHARDVPEDLRSLHQAAGFDSTDPAWMNVSLHGVMTTARREIYIRASAVREAIRQYHEHDRRLLYPVGTIIFGEHHLEGRRVETTVMRKRSDGFWDFMVYGADDSLAEGTATPPRTLDSPVQCVGCHFGDRLFEPERSFPAPARPGPHGPRQLYVSESRRDAEVVRYFDEHRKRSDTVLGLYSTLFVSQLRAARRSGELSEDDAELLDSLDL